MMSRLGYIFCILVLGFATFLNSFLNPFMWDDSYQIIDSPFVHSLDNIPYMFLTSIDNQESTNLLFGHYYKPFMFILYALLYSAGNGEPLVFHLIQVALHSINAVILWYIYQRFFSRKVALVLSLLFLTHPMQQETVVYIANMQDVLFFFFGSLGLLTVMYTKTRYMLLLGSVLSIFSCLSKETGVLFFFLTFVYVVFFRTRAWKFYTISSGIFSLIYLFLRLLGGQKYFVYMTIPYVPLLERLTFSPVLIAFYFREALLPSWLVTQPRRFAIPEIPPLEYTLALVISSVVVVILALCLKKSFKSEPALRNTLYFFLIWLVLGLSLHIQIIQLDQALTKRWFYFPLAGLLGVVGIYFQMLLTKYKKRTRIIFGIAAVVLIFFTVQTYVMNTYWQNQTKLEKHTLPW